MIYIFVSRLENCNEMLYYKISLNPCQQIPHKLCCTQRNTCVTNETLLHAGVPVTVSKNSSRTRNWLENSVIGHTAVKQHLANRCDPFVPELNET